MDFHYGEDATQMFPTALSFNPQKEKKKHLHTFLSLEEIKQVTIKKKMS